MNQRHVFRAAALGAALCWSAGILGVLFAIPTGLNPQPSELPGPRADFLAIVTQHPAAELRFFGTDFLFVIGYLLVFIGLYAITAQRGRPIAVVALGAGLLAAMFDSVENTFYVVNALGSRNGAELTEPALPLLYYITNLKWTTAITCVALFATIFPFDTGLSRTIGILLFVFPLMGAMAIAVPQLMPMRALFFAVTMPLLAIYFLRKSRESAAA